MLDEEISVYGIADNSNYVKIKKLSSLKKNEVYISTSFADKYGLTVGDTVSLDESMKTNLTSLKLRDFMTSPKVLRSLCRLTITEKYLN